MQIAHEKACDHGVIDHSIPHREYDYSEYFSTEQLQELSNVREAHIGVDMKELTNKGRASVLLGIVLAANRQKIVDTLHKLKEKEIQLVPKN